MQSFKVNIGSLDKQCHVSHLGSSLRLPADCHALLHLRDHRHAGMRRFPFVSHSLCIADGGSFPLELV